MENVSATKGQLTTVVRSLKFAKVGRLLMAQRRDIFIQELMSLISRAKEIKQKIDIKYHEAYIALQQANITIGIITELVLAIPEENTLGIATRSIMGIEIPTISINTTVPKNYVPVSLYNSNTSIDDAFLKFTEIKYLTVAYVEVEVSIYRLTQAIKSTKKRANALQYIVIPNLEKTLKFIVNSLEEKEREEFIRLRMIKKLKY
ncbi:MAG: V-type ATP synthase subunit D [Candidatus Improbicoccus devescovinae]|nr:MAG: V-type ATP synthase subunit D [Candidatus Improbicoccus devescovinae]